MSSKPIQVEVEPDLITVEVRDLLTGADKVTDVLDATPLRFRVTVPIRTTPAACSRPGTLAPALARRLQADVVAVLEDARQEVDKELETLAGALRKLLKNEGSAEDAAKLVKAAVGRMDGTVDSLPPKVREAIGRVGRGAPFAECFAKFKLCSVGTWGFARGDGLRARPGVFTGGTNTGDAFGTRLWQDLSAARSHSRQFVLVAASQVGLAIGSHIAGADLARAKEMAAGSATPLYGEVSYQHGAYHFQLDKAGTAGKRERLAKRVRDTIRTLCRKSVAVRFDDDDHDELGDKDD